MIDIMYNGNELARIRKHGINFWETW